MVSFDQKNFLNELIIKQHAFNKNSFRNSLLLSVGKDLQLIRLLREGIVT